LAPLNLFLSPKIWRKAELEQCGKLVLESSGVSQEETNREDASETMAWLQILLLYYLQLLVMFLKEASPKWLTFLGHGLHFRNICKEGIQ